MLYLSICYKLITFQLTNQFSNNICRFARNVLLLFWHMRQVVVYVENCITSATEGLHVFVYSLSFTKCLNAALMQKRKSASMQCLI